MIISRLVLSVNRTMEQTQLTQDYNFTVKPRFAAITNQIVTTTSAPGVPSNPPSEKLAPTVIISGPNIQIPTNIQIAIIPRRPPPTRTAGEFVHAVHII